VPSRLSSRCTGGRISIPIWEMANMQREESKHEKLEREQREREQDAASDCCLQGTGDEVSAVQNNRPERQAQRATALATTEC
jgi:hypothetical protein